MELTYVSNLIGSAAGTRRQHFHTQCRILIFAFCTLSTISAQIGASPTKVSPRLVEQMRRDAQKESATGFTVQELKEFKALHDADAELLRRTVSASRKYAELEQFVSGLDITVDTRLLTQALADIKDLQRIQREADEKAKANRAMIQSIQTGTIMLIIGAVLSGAVKLIKWVKFDPRRRRLAVDAVNKKEEDTAAALAKLVEQVKADLASSGCGWPPATDTTHTRPICIDKPKIAL